MSEGELKELLIEITINASMEFDYPNYSVFDAIISEEKSNYLKQLIKDKYDE